MFDSMIVFIFVVIFLTLFFLVGYDFLIRYLDRKYQAIYSYYDPRYSRNLRPGCLPGCTSKGECPNGNFCYNALGPNPTCCAYDFQCESCKTESRIPPLPNRLQPQPHHQGIIRELPDRLQPQHNGVPELPDRLQPQHNGVPVLPDRLQPNTMPQLPDRLRPEPRIKTFADRVRETLRPLSDRLVPSMQPMSENVSGRESADSRVGHTSHNVPGGHPIMR